MTLNNQQEGSTFIHSMICIKQNNLILSVFDLLVLTMRYLPYGECSCFIVKVAKSTNSFRSNNVRQLSANENKMLM